MPTYDTPAPIDLAMNLQVGSIEIIAGDRTDTVVTIAPTHPDRTIDRRAAEETSVAFDGTRLTITSPRPRLSWIGPTESVDVVVELPTGSRLTAEISVGGVRTVGRLGATRIKSATGAVHTDTTGDLWVRAMHGNVSVGAADGSVEITADHGQIKVGTVEEDAVLKASHGSITLGEVRGDVDAKLSYGDLEITRAHASVTAKTAYGSISLHEVASGSVQVETGYGEVTIGVRRGTPAWLDVSSTGGHVRNQLTTDAAPDPSEQTVAVRARTQYGDITLLHAR